MRRLSPVRQDCLRMKQMNALYAASRRQHSAGLLIRETPRGAGSQPLEVNVIFTHKQATAAALKSAKCLGRGLGASIHLHATIVVPFRLSLDQPPVSVPFMERLLCSLAAQPEQETSEVTIHLYVCRNPIETILQVLRPNSLVVIGAPRRWWPPATSRLARRLRARGHRVVFVNVKGQTTGLCNEGQTANSWQPK